MNLCISIQYVRGICVVATFGSTFSVALAHYELPVDVVKKMYGCLILLNATVDQIQYIRSTKH